MVLSPAVVLRQEELLHTSKASEHHPVVYALCMHCITVQIIFVRHFAEGPPAATHGHLVKAHSSDPYTQHSMPGCAA